MKETYKCQNCKQPFSARIADRKRGWARFCSKSCKAKKQESRTGQYTHYLRGKKYDETYFNDAHLFSNEE